MSGLWDHLPVEALIEAKTSWSAGLLQESWEKQLESIRALREIQQPDEEAA